MESGPLASITITSNHPSFQDLSDSELDTDDDDDEDWDDINRAAQEAFTDDEREVMIHYLKEKGLFAFIKNYLELERIPIKRLLRGFGVLAPDDLPFSDQIRLLKMACARILRNRTKLANINTLTDVLHLLRTSKKIMILSGAGVSTSCGIPDFRSPTGLYARLKEENWDLEDPQEMFDLAFFRERPTVFYSFAKEIYPSNFTPSPCHRFVKLLEQRGKLLRNYTQNIDGLFEQVGLPPSLLLNCHGSFSTASCLACRATFPGSSIERDVFESRVPLCPLCTPGLEERERERERERRRKEKGAKGWKEDSEEEEEEGEGGEWEGKAVVKPDIVFFGENLSDEFDRKLFLDREEVDLLIVMGTSLRVSPVATIVGHLPHSVPQILINRDPVTHANFDVHLLGDGDTIVRYLCEELGWDLDNEVPVKVGRKGSLADRDHQDHHPADARALQLPAPVPVPVIPQSQQQPPSIPEIFNAPSAGSPPNPSTTATTTTTTPASTSTIIPLTKGEIVPERVSHSHVWLFPGADRNGRWVESVRMAFDEESGEEEEEEEEEEEGEEPATSTLDPEVGVGVGVGVTTTTLSGPGGGPVLVNNVAVGVGVVGGGGGHLKVPTPMETSRAGSVSRSRTRSPEGDVDSEEGSMGLGKKIKLD
ncbi:DHS-like NAD/FAD-binding domain-containing protein [Meredithblackwellia eburnea MCA 4105]